MTIPSPPNSSAIILRRHSFAVREFSAKFWHQDYPRVVPVVLPDCSGPTIAIALNCLANNSTSCVAMRVIIKQYTQRKLIFLQLRNHIPDLQEFNSIIVIFLVLILSESDDRLPNHYNAGQKAFFARVNEKNACLQQFAKKDVH